jgi:hypothetical protein
VGFPAPTSGMLRMRSESVGGWGCWGAGGGGLRRAGGEREVLILLLCCGKRKGGGGVRQKERERNAETADRVGTTRRIYSFILVEQEDLLMPISTKFGFCTIWVP